MAKFQLQPGEQLLQAPLNVGHRKGVRVALGPAYLTDRRFVHVDRTWRRAMPIGPFRVFMKGKVDIDVPWRDIAWLSLHRFGLNKLLKITTVNGEEHRLVCTPVQEWIKAFAQALARCDGARLVEHRPEVWKVERARSHQPTAARPTSPYGYAP